MLWLLQRYKIKKRYERNKFLFLCQKKEEDVDWSNKCLICSVPQDLHTIIWEHEFKPNFYNRFKHFVLLIKNFIR